MDDTRFQLLTSRQQDASSAKISIGFGEGAVRLSGRERRVSLPDFLGNGQDHRGLGLPESSVQAQEETHETEPGIQGGEH